MDLEQLRNKATLGPELPQTKEIVLLIEDSKETGESLVAMLEACGFSAILASDVKSAVNYLIQCTPDIIISDLNLPNRSGADLFSETRKHAVWSQIPFLFISGDVPSEIRQQNVRLGADNFLLKPLEPKELKATIEGRLIQSRSRKQLEITRFENFRKRIIHTLSHEFRTPLVSITTGTELLLDEYQSLKEEQVQTLLRSILKGGQRLERLVEDFMVMQQIDIGYAEKSFAQYKCITPIRDLLELLNSKLREYVALQYPTADIIFELDSGIELKVIEIYPDQMVDALFRFIDNGLKFSSPKAKTKLKISDKEGMCRFEIRDWGTGFDNKLFPFEQSAKPFEQFNREVYEQQGCGLGLSIASYFLSLHEVSLKIRKPEDEVGTLVEIMLPFCKQE